MTTPKKTTKKPAAAKAAPAKAKAAAPDKPAKKQVVYKVIQRFRDTDDDRIYEVGDVYEGKRAAYFAGTSNRCGRSFLKKA